MIISKPTKAKPFIKWVGGKSQLIPTLEKFLPKNFSQLENLTYIEPFIGGGAMLFYMLQHYSNIKRAVINDLNPDLVKAYKTIKATPELLVQNLHQIEKEYLRINNEQDRKSFYLTIREIFNKKNISEVDNTTFFIFLNRTCFNGLYRVNSKGDFNVPFGKYKNPTICDINTIYADSELLQKVEITNEDFEHMEQYVTENTFIYFDPPYRPLDATSCFNSYSKEKFNDNEQIRLKHFFDHLSDKKCLMMLSNSDCKGRNPEDIFLMSYIKTILLNEYTHHVPSMQIPTSAGN